MSERAESNLKGFCSEEKVGLVGCVERSGSKGGYEMGEYCFMNQSSRKKVKRMGKMKMKYERGSF